MVPHVNAVSVSDTSWYDLDRSTTWVGSFLKSSEKKGREENPGYQWGLVIFCSETVLNLIFFIILAMAQ